MHLYVTPPKFDKEGRLEDSTTVLYVVMVACHLSSTDCYRGYITTDHFAMIRIVSASRRIELVILAYRSTGIALGLGGTKPEN